MKKENAQNMIKFSIFWGSLWGLTEATLGTLLHTVPWVAGFFMFPIGFFFMKKAFNQTDRLPAIFYTAATAAAIKLTGLFLPFQAPVKSLNPAASILMESVAVILFIKYFANKKAPARFGEAFLLSMGWRFAFVAYHLLLVVLSLYDGILGLGGFGLLRFLVLESLVNGALILSYLRLEQKEKIGAFGFLPRPGLVHSILVFAAAIIAELLL